MRKRVLRTGMVIPFLDFPYTVFFLTFYIFLKLIVEQSQVLRLIPIIESDRSGLSEINLLLLVAISGFISFTSFVSEYCALK